MNLRDIKTDSFDETINISSNIKDNKRTIIGKFDLRDILFLLIAAVVGILIVTITVFILHIKNIFILMILLAVFEVPILTFGFMKTYNMPYIDFLKLKDKSKRTVYRKQIVNRKIEKNRYVMTFHVDFIDSINFQRIENIINELKDYLHFNNIQIKLFNKNTIFLTFSMSEKVVENKDVIIDYKKFFDFCRLNADIKYLSIDDIRNYGKIIKPIKLYGKKYNKDSLKSLEKDRLYIEKIKPFELKSSKDSNITNELILNYKKEYCIVYKIILYKTPFDINILDKLLDVAEITLYTEVSKKFSIINISFLSTYIFVVGDNDNILNRIKYVEDILKENNIIYKTINEDKVKESLLFTMENRY